MCVCVCVCGMHCNTDVPDTISHTTREEIAMPMVDTSYVTCMIIQ